MDEYNRLLSKINEYLEMDDVIFDGEVISAYDLYKCVEDKFLELKKIVENKELIKKINSEYLSTFDKILSLFSRSLPELDKRCRKSHVEIDDDNCNISFYFGSGMIPYSRCLEIIKERRSGALYFGEFDELDDDKKFLEKYFEEIMDIFDVLEEFYDLNQKPLGGFYKSKSLREEHSFSDDFLKVTLRYDDYGRVSIGAEIEKDQDPNDIAKREWYGFEKLTDVIDGNLNLILKKVPIAVEDLNYTCKRIIGEKILKDDRKIYTKR